MLVEPSSLACRYSCTAPFAMRFEHSMHSSAAWPHLRQSEVRGWNASSVVDPTRVLLASVSSRATDPLELIAFSRFPSADAGLRDRAIRLLCMSAQRNAAVWA
jgi:hypothetical protein